MSDQYEENTSMNEENVSVDEEVSPVTESAPAEETASAAPEPAAEAPEPAASEPAGYESAGREEYRRAPYMREGGNTYQSRGSDDGRYAYDDPNRYRTRYPEGGNGPKKGGGRIVAAVIAAALVLGGIAGVACWKLGSNIVAVDNRGAVIETMAPEHTEAPSLPEGTAAAAAESTEEDQEAVQESAAEETVLQETLPEVQKAAETPAALATTAMSMTQVETTAEPVGIAGVLNETTGTVLQAEEPEEADGEVRAAVNNAGDQEEAAEESTQVVMNEDTSAAAEGEAQAVLNSADAQIETAAAAENQTPVKALDVTEVVEVAMPSVVSITTTAVYESYNNNSFDPFYYYFYGGFGNYGNNGGGSQYQVKGAGSGIIIGDDGKELWIVTNNHVVDGADTLAVTFSDDTTVTAYVKGTDPGDDLAVVGVNLSDLSDTTKQTIRAVKMGDSDSLKLGETVIAIGNALGLGQSVSTGVVSALNREITTSAGSKLTTIQTDAAINPGNSGGALLDAAGELIGINVAKDAETDVEGMGYAIPISSAKDIIQRLTITREAVSEDQYPYMGVQLQDISSEVASAYRLPEGILVYGITDNSPARAAGMLEQDIITAFNGIPVRTYEELTNELKYYAGGTTVTVTVQRLENGAYQSKDLTMTLAFRKDYQTSAPNNGQQGQQDNGQQGQQDNGQQGQQNNGQQNNGQQNGNQNGGIIPFGGQQNNNGNGGWNGFSFGN